MAAISEQTGFQPGWLRGPGFDLTFVAGIAAIALLSGVAVMVEPALFVPILLLDLWLLGYHHVIATYTRLCFDRQSLANSRFLLFGLPPLVLAGTAALAFGAGFWAVASLYLYWQWFHYTRQSWGVSQVYRRKAGGLADDPEQLSKLSFYLLPLWGILYRSYQAPERFLGMELKVLPVPGLLVDAVGVLALAGLGWWLFNRLLAWRRGRLALAHTAFVLSHHVVFFVGYILIEDITHGWLVINIWHNAQYILFVWLFNSNRYRSGPDPQAKFLSEISQPGNAWRYFLVCFAISTLIYLAIDQAAGTLAVVGLPVALVIYQTINFHHYIVDSLIWKVRKRPLQKVLDLNS